jgi:hypothetical protein
MKPHRIKKIANGIWTPWSEVLCAACHGHDEHTPWTKAKHKELKTPHPLANEDWSSKGIGTCDKCGTTILLPIDIVDQLLIRDAARQAGAKSDLWQSGGMTCNCTMMLGKHILVTGCEDVPGMLSLTEDVNDSGTGPVWFEGNIQQMSNWIRAQLKTQ